jgi:membrane protein
MIPSDRTHDPTAGRGSGDGSRRSPRALVRVVQSRFAGSSAESFVKRLGVLNFFETVTVFGAVLLLSALPFIILMSSLANHSIDADLSRHIGLNSQGADIVSELFTSSPTDSVSAIVVALIVATVGTMAVASSLQGIYERAFGQEHRGWRDVFRYLTWVGVLFGVLVAESVISGPVRASLGPVGQAFVTYAGIAAFFWWTMYFLLAGRVRGRILVRSAILTALLWIGLDIFSSTYFSAAIVSDNRIYGKIGVAFTLLTWFIAIGAVIVLGTTLGATWEQRKGRLGGPKADLLGIVHHRPSSGLARR